LATEYGVAPSWIPSNDGGEQMNRLVRGEISAVEALNQVMEILEDVRELQMIQSMLNDHRGFINYFQAMAVRQGEMPERDSGPWGAFVSFFVGVSKLFGNEAALKALREGHEHGMEEYKKLLDSDEVPSEVKSTVRTKMIPAIEGHIASINELINRQ